MTVAAALMRESSALDNGVGSVNFLLRRNWLRVAKCNALVDTVDKKANIACITIPHATDDVTRSPTIGAICTFLLLTATIIIGVLPLSSNGTI
jgi:hypothetical protein